MPRASSPSLMLRGDEGGIASSCCRWGRVVRGQKSFSDQVTQPLPAPAVHVTVDLTFTSGPLVCKSESALLALGQKGLEQTWISNQLNFQTLHVDFSGEAGYRDLEGVKLKGVQQEEIHEPWKNVSLGYLCFFLHQKNAFLRLNTRRPNL